MHSATKNKETHDGAKYYLHEDTYYLVLEKVDHINKFHTG